MPAETKSWRSSVAVFLAAPMIVALFTLSASTGPAASYLAILSALAGLALTEPKRLRAWSVDWGMMMLVAAFVVIAAAFSLSANDISDLAAIGDFLILLVALPAYLVFRLAARRSAALTVAVAAWIGAAIAVISGGYEVYVLNLGRATGGFTPIYFSDIGAALGFVALLGILAPGPKWRWLLVSGPLLGLACVQLGGTRGALVGIAVLALVAGVAVLRRWPKHWWHLLLGVGAAAAIIIAVAATIDISRLAAVPALIAQALGGGETSDASLNYRLEFYSAGFQAFLASPVFGHGWWERFPAALPYMSPEAAALYVGPVSHLHNDMINFASAAGLLGLLAYGLMMLAPMVSAWRSPHDSQRPFRLAASAAMSLGFLAFGLSDAVFVFEVPKTFYILGSVAILGFCRDEPLRA